MNILKRTLALCLICAFISVITGCKKEKSSADVPATNAGGASSSVTDSSGVNTPGGTVIGNVSDSGSSGVTGGATSSGATSSEVTIGGSVLPQFTPSFEAPTAKITGVAVAEKVTAEQSKTLYGHAANQNPGYETYLGSRNIWLWPFSRTSLWNMPIGSNAVYEPAGFEEEGEVSADGAILINTLLYKEQGFEILNKIPIYSVNPMKSGLYPTDLISDLKDRWVKTDVIGKYTSILEQRVTTDWPKELTVAAGRTHLNDCCSVLQLDGRKISEIQPTCRDEIGASYLFGNAKLVYIDIYETGEGGSHWGSGISNYGGTIRLGELTGDDNDLHSIKHAIKLNVEARKYLYYNASDTSQNFCWPADRSDTRRGSFSGFDQNNPNLKTGSLLALPRNLTPESIGIKTVIGKKLFYAFQDYGAYIVDDTARSAGGNLRGAYAISVENGEDTAVLNKYNINMRTLRIDKGDSNEVEQSELYRQDIMKIVTNLCVITNNSKTNVGGGGTPCRPLAPDIK